MVEWTIKIKFEDSTKIEFTIELGNRDDAKQLPYLLNCAAKVIKKPIKYIFFVKKVV